MIADSLRTVLHGRAEEQTVIERLLGSLGGGRSRVLVLRGDPGIGKSALLDHAARTAADAGVRVIRGTGVASEAQIPFAGLHLLLRPALHRLQELPEPQLNALRGAFGLAPAGPGDRLLVGLAVLSLLSELAGEGPLLCLVDDAHWLDRESAEALMFAARRLDAEGLGLVFAERHGEEALPADGLPELRLTGLEPEAAATLLDAELPPAVRYRVLAEAHGNPLALLELPAALAAEPPGAAFRPGALPLTDRLRVTFHGQVSRLPAATRTLLLLVASDDGGELAAVLRAAAALGAGVADLPPAEDAGLVRLDERAVTFRHPLVRAAVYQGAPLSRRLAAHAAMAAALDGPDDADRRAWHRAAATTGTDEAVARELEHTAVRAGERSGHAGAAAAYERAAHFTADPDARARRLTLAAESAAESGALHSGRGPEIMRQAGQAIRQAGDASLEIRLTHVRAFAAFAEGAFPMAHRLLLEGAGRLAEADATRAVRMLLQALHTGWYMGERELEEAVDRLAGLPLEQEPLARYALAAAAPLVGRPVSGVPSLRDTLGVARRAGASDPRQLTVACGLSLVLGQDDELYEMAARLATEYREQGGIGVLPTLLFFLAEAELFHGRHRDAADTATEALRIAEDTGQRQWASQLKSFLAYMAALEGDGDQCRELSDQAMTVAAAGAVAAGAQWVRWALGLLELGQGRAETALIQLEGMAHGATPYHVSGLRCVPDLVEAAVRLGEPSRVAAPMSRFEAWVDRIGQPWADALLARCRALLADAGAEEHFQAALRHHDAVHRPFERARTALLYGEWLRRDRRKAEASTQLRTALEAFERVGALPWVDRARTELDATGTGAAAAHRGQERGALAVLTPQELQIVRLAAGGLSNKDIAAQLFLSPRTVGHHLYKAYPKLGVASRGELRELISESGKSGGLGASGRPGAAAAL